MTDTINLTIAIPARYNSTRFPGKPLAMIGNKSMLNHVVDVAQEATEFFNSINYININIFVTTDDDRIAEHAAEIGAPCLMTPETCATGSDRVLAALRKVPDWPDFIINFQGDAPFTPISVLQKMVQAFLDDTKLEVVTPVQQLSWENLDRLRALKQETPFTGTTALVNKQQEAIWFSKNIIPALRNEEALRKQDALSPVYQHMGLYGFRIDVLEKFCNLPQSRYETLEGLEQLRMLENGIKIQTVKIDSSEHIIQSGVDTPEDLEREEALFNARNNAAA